MIGGGGKLKGFSQLLQKVTKMNVVAGMLNTVRIADAHASAYESIDVISILAAASRQPGVVSCMSRPEPIVIHSEPEHVTETPQAANQATPVAPTEEVYTPLSRKRRKKWSHAQSSPRAMTMTTTMSTSPKEEAPSLATSSKKSSPAWKIS